MVTMAVLVLLVLCSSIVLWSLRWLSRVWWRPKVLERQLRKQGIHCLPYKFLYGDMKEVTKLNMDALSKPMKLKSHDIAPRLDPFLLQRQAMANKKPFVIWLGTTPRVVIMDPKLAMEVLTRKFDFHKHDTSPTMKLFLTGLANHEGEKWATHRKIINPAFHMEKLKRMQPVFMACCDDMIQKWEKLVGSEGSRELDALIEFQNLTGDIISRAAFGSNIEEGKLIFQLQREQGELFVQAFFKVSPWLLRSKAIKRMKQIYKEMGDVLSGIIDKREKAIRSGSAVDDDLLNLLLKSNLNQVQDNKKNSSFRMTREDVIDECKLFYLAGHETTANLLTWTMIALSMHLDWQEKARQEVLTILGENTPSFDNLSHLKIVHMILLEVLRLYPPTSLLRFAYKETKLGDYTLPAGVGLYIPLYLIHRDPKLWGQDAKEFNPERFSDGVSKASVDQYAYFPFGWGPRICVGQNFALMEAKLALAMILQRFSFELSPTYTHSPFVLLTLQPQFGAQIILRKI